ncbi:MAG: ATP-binding cassette domain-containing protein, partial [Pseudomonadota bacterium]
LCESATVLRRGAVVARLDPRERAPADIAALMIGARVPAVKREHDATEPVEKLRLRVAGLAMPAEPPHGMALRNINFVVRAGEIFGIAGVAGEGQSELMAALSGERRSPVAGSVQIGRHRIGRAGPSARRRVGAAFVPEERLGHAAVPEMDLADNVILAHHAVLPLAPGGLLSRGRARAWVERVRAAFDVRGGGQGAVPKAGALSGGNLQKFVVGREILRKPKILVVNQPTWGVDAGAAAVIRQALVDLAGEGAGIVVISQDLDELFEIADRMAVMQNGRLSYARPTEEFTPESIGLLMAQGALDPEDVPRKRRKRRGSGSGSGSLGGGDRAARGRFSIAGLFSGTRGYGRAW